MAVNYPSPGSLPWLQPPDTAGNFLRAYQAGAQVAAEQARLQAEAQRTSLQLAEQDRQMKMEQQREQAQLNAQRAYHEATIGLQQSRLDEAKQRVQIAAQSAAQKFQAQSRYQSRYQELVDGGMSPQDASTQAMREIGPAMGATPASLATMNKSGAAGKPTWVPADPKTGAPAYLMSPSGVPHFAPVKKPDEITIPQKAMILRQKEKEITSNHIFSLPSRPKNADLAKQWDKLHSDYDKVSGQLDDLISRKPQMPSQSERPGFIKYQKAGGKPVWVPDDPDSIAKAKKLGYTEANAD